MIPAFRQRCVYCAVRSQHTSKQARRHATTHAKSVIRRVVGIGKTLPEDRPVGKSGPARLTKKFPGGSRAERYEDVLQKLVVSLKEELGGSPIVEQLREERKQNGDPFPKLWSSFKSMVSSDAMNFLPGRPDQDFQEIRRDLRVAFLERGSRGLESRIRYNFYGFVTATRFTKSDLKRQQAVADLRYPIEWYPATREVSRTIHMHVGPTNSGKTYHALKRLETAKYGVYAGPLRLLAHEVYSRMNAKGIPCRLITGEERRIPSDKGGMEVAEGETTPFSRVTACTVEMMPMNAALDVAVIDEIQMIGNAERGWAWTQAVLGVQAKEVHLCGEERTVPIIQEICALTGEKCIIHRYERLSPLKMADRSLRGDLKNLRKGDCIVSFSVMGIHALRKQIEENTNKKVAIVYGSLPPETRAQQARLFNDPDNNYDFLVASDAIGMGLNLAIKRVIFETSNKFDGYKRLTLPIADIKQIGGRAGRYKTAAQANEDTTTTPNSPAPKKKGSVPAKDPTLGLVTTLDEFDFPIVSEAMESDPEPIRTAGIFPPSDVLVRFASYFPPKTPFSYILMRLHEASQVQSRFHLCGLKDYLWMADLIEPVTNLTIQDRNIICACPASSGDKDLWKKLLPALARCIADQGNGALYEIEEMPLEILEAPMKSGREYLRELERLHKGLVCYLWLSYRFAGIFTTRPLAMHVKEMVEEKIESCLSDLSFDEKTRRSIAKSRQAQLMANLKDALELDQAKREAAAKPVDAGESADESTDEASDDLLDDTQSIANPDQQTSLTSGGDHFGGEEDLGLEDGLAGDPVGEEAEEKPIESDRSDDSGRSAGFPFDEGQQHVEGEAARSP